MAYESSISFAAIKDFRNAEINGIPALFTMCRIDSETLPTELNFTFSNKFNELYSSGFYTYSASCDLPLSGVVTISRVPLVFHALHDLFL